RVERPRDPRGRPPPLSPRDRPPRGGARDGRQGDRQPLRGLRPEDRGARDRGRRQAHLPGRHLLSAASPAASPASPWRAALPFARIGFLNMLAFRARYYVGVLTYLFNVAVYYFIWRAVFRQGGTVAGMTLRDMVTYVAVGWAIRSFYFNEI